MTLSVIRSAGGLCEWVSRPAPEGDGFELAVSTKTAGSEGLRASWAALGAVRVADATTLFHVAVVLLETVPKVGEAAALPGSWGVARVEIRATRAHPRAFQGTKYQPPKRRSVEAFDLRPHLNHPRSLRAVLAPLWRHWDQVRLRLLRAGYTSEQVGGLEREVSGKAAWNLPERFAWTLWPAVRFDRRERSRWLAWFGRWELDGDARLMAAVGRLVAEYGASASAAWVEMGEALVPERRAVFLETVLAAGVPPASREIAEAVAEVGALAEADRFGEWVEALLGEVKKGRRLDYLRSGFRLASEYRPNYFWGHIGYADDFSEGAVRDIAEGLAGEHWAMLLWERCGRFAGLGGILAKCRWREFPSAAQGYFEMFAACEWNDDPERARQRRWAAIREQLPRIEQEILATAAEFQGKYIGIISDWLFDWSDPVEMRTLMPRAWRWARRLAAPPLATRRVDAEVWTPFLRVDHDTWDRMARVPDRAVQEVEEACRRRNDFVLIHKGLRALVDGQPGFAVDALEEEPPRLCKTAKLLGCLRRVHGEEVVRQAATHPLFDDGLAGLALRELCQRVAAALEARHANPIPAKARAWAEGDARLSDAQLARYRQVVLDRLTLTRLSVIDGLARDRLTAAVAEPAEVSVDEHALRLLGSIGDNRRGLRQFLRAYVAGDHEYLQRHPANLAWYRKHPSIPRRVWEEGVAMTRDGVTLAVERDPFEVLKLGTYVGSCLALGGMYDDSAAAALLDANKQVVYARDERGRVVARQLVAISEQDQLICFSVYPHKAGQRIGQLFGEYGRLWAAALGIPVYRETEESTYHVAVLLAESWWDDAVWARPGQK